MRALLGTVSRILARLVAFILFALLALVGLALAVFCIGGADGTLSLPNLAEIAGLPAVRDAVGGFLDRLETATPVDLVPALFGLLAIVLGAMLIFGSATGRRERRFHAAGGGEGDLVARPRAVTAAARTLLSATPGVSAVDVSAQPGRRSGALDVRVSHPPTADANAVRTAAEEALQPLRESFGLRTSVKTRRGEAGSRVE